MAKTNFDKVEDSLGKGLERIKIDKIIAESLNRDAAAEKECTPKLFLIRTISFDMQDIPLVDKDFFKKLGISKKELANLLKNPDKLTDSDWKLLKEIRAKILEIKAILLKKYPLPTNEELVESQRALHINRRFNVNERWLPLQ